MYNFSCVRRSTYQNLSGLGSSQKNLSKWDSSQVVICIYIWVMLSETGK